MNVLAFSTWTLKIQVYSPLKPELTCSKHRLNTNSINVTIYCELIFLQFYQRKNLLGNIYSHVIPRYYSSCLWTITFSCWKGGIKAASDLDLGIQYLLFQFCYCKVRPFFTLRRPVKWTWKWNLKVNKIKSYCGNRFLQLLNLKKKNWLRHSWLLSCRCLDISAAWWDNMRKQQSPKMTDTVRNSDVKL